MIKERRTPRFKIGDKVWQPGSLRDSINGEILSIRRYGRKRTIYYYVKWPNGDPYGHLVQETHLVKYLNGLDRILETLE